MHPLAQNDQNQADDFAKILGAAMDGNDDAMRTFLDTGANINALNSYGKSPLHMAILNSSPGIVDFLLRHGADPQVRTATGDTALELARHMERSHILPLLENKISEVD